MNITKLARNVTADVLEDVDGNIVERFTFSYRGRTIQINRHNRDDNQVTLAFDGNMLPRMMSLSEVDSSIEVNT